MPETVIDLRSDTVTRPSPAMRRAMAEAAVGDDVYHEDPTVNRLEEKFAAMLGKEAAVFVASGTMSNQIAIRAHCQPGDELLCESGAHIYNYEQGAPAQLSGVMCRTLSGDYGILDVEDFDGMIRPENEHLVRTRLVCLENTHNRGGGRIFPFEKIERICAWAHENGLVTHLDGARLFNAAVATGIEASRWAKHFDTVSVCFSKGLGAPVGSALAGSQALIDRARRHRKVFGGAMRQAGILAAGALYALENNVNRLAEDHANAQVLARAIGDCEGLELTPPKVETNLIWFRVDRSLATGPQLCAALRRRGVLVGNSGGGQDLRACTHLDVNHKQTEHATRVIQETVAQAQWRLAGHGSPVS